jgi:hypothetical protein
MRKLTSLITAYVLVLGVAPGPVFAQSTHFKHGSPTSHDGGLTLTVSGVLAGLGNGDLRLKLGALANPIASCCNPGAACKVPGQNPAAAEVTSGTTLIPSSAIKNGNASFSVTTNAPESPIPDAPQCPNSSWQEIITDMQFTQAGLRIQQSSGAGLTDFSDVLAACISFVNPTTNGDVPSTNIASIEVGVFTGGPVGSCAASLFPEF